uniref:Uncharacterized protein n=1 Tax=Siphoviridae sp. ctuUw41 TaxID=2826503 RepID=A0A8S5MYD5_9CAUD|nr:MAG TPA: hypothetical protein [Siphoviridae sp. ctuUw41]
MYLLTDLLLFFICHIIHPSLFKTEIYINRNPQQRKNHCCYYRNHF